MVDNQLQEERQQRQTLQIEVSQLIKELEMERNTRTAAERNRADADSQLKKVSFFRIEKQLISLGKAI